MGNDGGSIPKRRELVKEAARNPTTTELKESQHEQQEYYWTTDPISRKPLTRPVVSDSNGKLYNKDTIIEFLLPANDGASKSEAEGILQGSVKTLKDIVEVKFEVDDTIEKKTTASGILRKEMWKCPVTGDILGPGSKAAYLVPCGHAFSGSAIKEVSGEKCLQCDTEYASNDIIPILPTASTDIARLSLRIKSLKERGLTHSLKKSSKDKKRKKHDEEKVDEVATIPITNGHATPDASKKEPSRTATPTLEAATSGERIQNSSTRALADKVQAEMVRKKQKLDQNDNLKSLFSKQQGKASSKNSADYMTRGFSISANAKR